MELEESALIEAARCGDPEAFGVIVRRYMPKALAFARQLTGSAEDAQDLAQEAFVKAYKGLGSFRGESKFNTWFFRVLSNICLDHLRRAAFFRRVSFFSTSSGDEEGKDPLETTADTHPESAPDGVLEQKELRSALDKALSRLPARQRAVFLLRHDEGLTLMEISAVLGISEGAVKSHLARSVTALRKTMKDWAAGGKGASGR